jgi:flagellar hook-associated protein 1 FlgK
MGMSTAMNSALSGLRVSQAQLDVVSQNIANADSVGYARRKVGVVQQVSADRTSGAQISGIERQLDKLVQRQLRIETAGAAYTDLKARAADEIDRLFGQPGQPGALDGAINAFTGALQQLVTSPADITARAGVMAEARALAGTIAGLSNDMQALRERAEAQIADQVERANVALRQIVDTDRRIASNTRNGGSNAALLDERDRAIQELASLVDLRVVEQPNGTAAIFTSAGLQLSGAEPVTFAFDARGALSATSLNTADPVTRGVGTLKVVSASGVAVDVAAGRLIRSGEMAAALELRDRTLVDAQARVDELAARLSSALSDRDPTVPVTTGTNAGFDIALADPLAPASLAMRAGNTLTLTVATPAGSRRVHLVATDGTAPSPLTADMTSEPGATLVRYDRAGGFAGVQAALATALGPGFSVTLQPGNVLRVLDAAGGFRVENARAAFTVAGLAGAGPELPLFVDAATGAAFTGSLDGPHQQRLGFAGRIRVNPAVEADTSRLAVIGIGPGTPQGDSTRASFMLDRLTAESMGFGAPGLGDATSGYQTTVADFARRVIEVQGAEAARTARVDQGQKLVLRSIEARFSEASGVSIDQEMGDLVQIQNVYAANARVVSAVKDLFDLLLRIGA